MLSHFDCTKVPNRYFSVSNPQTTRRCSIEPPDVSANAAKSCQRSIGEPAFVFSNAFYSFFASLHGISVDGLRSRISSTSVSVSGAAFCFSAPINVFIRGFRYSRTVFSSSGLHRKSLAYCRLHCDDARHNRADAADVRFENALSAGQRSCLWSACF